MLARILRMTVYGGWLWVAVTVASTGCGRGGGGTPTSPNAGLDATPAPLSPASLPARLWGAFTAAEDVPEAAAHAGNVVLVLPQYAEDARRVAGALRATGKVAILSTHHVFSNPRARWQAEWEATQRWAEPLAGLIAAVYVVDEPASWGMSPEALAEAISIARGMGLPLMIAEGVDAATRAGYSRPPVDLFGVTCYMWPGPGSWSMRRCEEAYRTHPSWNVVIGQGWDVYQGGGNGDTASQVARWAAIGRERAGTIFWVWRWAGQTGIGDDPALSAAYDREGGR